MLEVLKKLVQYIQNTFRSFGDQSMHFRSSEGKKERNGIWVVILRLI